jgi:hypothetical protein
VVIGRRLLAGALVPGALLAGAALAATAGRPAASAATSTPNASTLYREAMATTSSWSVHYVSRSTQSKVTLVTTGDTGPASGTQLVATGKGANSDSVTIMVIGGITYVKGNVGGLENLTGLTAAQATAAAGLWIKFATSNSLFSQVVAGVRSTDVARELALKGPLTLGRPRTIDGQPVDTIDGTQTFEGHKSPVVLYVRARGSHVPVEEDSLNSRGQPTSAEHVIYSNWGETVRPQAPQAALSIGPVSAT